MRQHQNRVASINTTFSTHQLSTMQRSFGQEISGNARGNKEFTSEQRAAILAKHDAGVMQKDIAEEFRCTRQCIGQTIKRWKNHATLDSLPRKGRTPLINRRECRLIIRTVRKYPKIQYRKLMEDVGLLNQHHPPSRRTVNRILAKQGLANHRCAKRPKLTHAHALLRLKFQRDYRNFNWRRRVVKFSDECLL